MERKTMGDWIDVNDKLPPNDELVLTYGFSDALYIIYWRQEVARYRSPDELKYWTNSHIKPTHWMDLPKPPKDRQFMKDVGIEDTK
jgi:hypothetical protein